MSPVRRYGPLAVLATVVVGAARFVVHGVHVVGPDLSTRRPTPAPIPTAAAPRGTR